MWPIELIVTYAGMSRLRGFEKLGNVTRVISDSTFDISSHFSTAPQNRDTGKVLMQKHILTGPSLELYQISKRVNIPGQSNLAPQSVLPILDLCMLARVWRVL